MTQACDNKKADGWRKKQNRREQSILQNAFNIALRNG